MHSEVSYKRLESGAFTWPPVRDGAMTLNAAQLRLLFTGMDWTQLGGAGHDSAGASPWNASGEMREIATPTG